MEDDDATVWLDDNDDPNSSILPFINPSKWLEEFTMEVEDNARQSLGLLDEYTTISLVGNKSGYILHISNDFWIN